MVIACIREGFGNQLFTYACGYSLAKEKETELVIDTTLLDNGRYRKLELLKTQIRYDKRISYKRKEDLINRAVWNKLRRRKAIGFSTKICRESGAWDYTPERFEIKRDIYLYGFWQSYHYFEKYEKDLKAMIIPQYDMPSFVREQMQRVKEEESVAVHIRRGDYVKIGCTLPLSYYQKAMKAMSEEIQSIKFYIFSDDIEFAKNALRKFEGKENAVFWEDCGKESTLNDFFLMSSCKHQIIANSTFSWWAAYVNGNENKKIFAPVIGNWKDNFYPNDWIKIIL